MLLLFLLSNISSSQSLPCSYMEIGAGPLGCFLEMASRATSCEWIISCSYCTTFLGQVALQAAKMFPCTFPRRWHGGTVAAQREGINPRARKETERAKRIPLTAQAHLNLHRAFHTCRNSLACCWCGNELGATECFCSPVSPAGAHVGSWMYIHFWLSSPFFPLALPIMHMLLTWARRSLKLLASHWIDHLRCFCLSSLTEHFQAPSFLNSTKGTQSLQ